MKDSPYFQQAELMLRVLPHMARETCFALKGGTAINFFVRDLPRLSVDIDLTYLPLEDRQTTLENIGSALRRIGRSIKKAISEIQVTEHLMGDSQRVAKLTVVRDRLRVKVEPNEVLRGTVYPVTERGLVPKAEELFEASISVQVLSDADLYGGKLCAALDRQHPRDLFDVAVLLDQEGLTETIRKAFIVYLISGDRPMSEILDPAPKRQKDLKVIFEDDFKGMTVTPMVFEDLLAVQEKLPSLIRSSLTNDEKAFILSVKEGHPRWDLLGLAGIDKLPAVQWKLLNIRKMSKPKHAQMIARLRKTLDL